MELLGLKNIDDRSPKVLLADLHSAALNDRWLAKVNSSRVINLPARADRFLFSFIYTISLF